MGHDKLRVIPGPFSATELSRRRLLLRAGSIGASGLTAAVAGRASAQVEGTPSASPASTPASGQVQTSITRDAFNAALRDAFPLEPVGSAGGTLIYTQITDIDTLNPLLVQDLYSSYITGAIYESLVLTSQIDGQNAPSLADSWDIAADGRTYTFHLNPDAAWQDGQPLTADDVVFTFDALLAEESLSTRRQPVVQAVASYAAVDAHTVQFVATAKLATFLEDAIVPISILPKHIWADVAPKDWGVAPGSTGQDAARVVGSGPFSFVEWVQGDHVTLKRHETYWDAQNAATLDRFIYRVVGDQQSAVESLRAGESDVVDLPRTQVDAFKERTTDVSVVEFDTVKFNYYEVNQDPDKSPLFTDVRVRQALHYALDRDLIAETIYQGYAIRADGTQPVLSIAYAPERISTIYTYDPDKARQLLAEAGWSDTDGDGIVDKDGVKFSFECLYGEGSAQYEQQIPYMQEAWKEIGLEMVPTSLPFPVLLEKTPAGDYEMAVQGFSWSPNGSQGEMYRCDATPPAGFNEMHYCNPRYDALDDQQLQELNQERRIDLLIEQSNIVNDELAIGIVVFVKDVEAARSTVHNFLPNGYSVWWSLPHIWVE